MAALKLLGIHGLGDQRDGSWITDWNEVLTPNLPAGFEFRDFSYDDIFERVEVTSWEAASATASLLASGFGSLFGGRGARRFESPREANSRGIFDGLDHWLKWYPGYVVGWLKSKQFRAEVRERLLKVIGDYQPDLILAHSLGSLISYDALTSIPDLMKFPAARNHLKNVDYVTLGSQLGNPFVTANLTPGRIVKPGTRRWWHLYNPNDRVFTAEIRLPGTSGFEQVVTPFDDEGLSDHDAVSYLGHSAARVAIWQPLSLTRATGESAATAHVAGARRLALQMSGEPETLVESTGKRKAAAKAESTRPLRKPQLKAVLVGIDEYPNPANNLAGCVNDVFKISQTLQERGFAPEEIRVVFNDRATARGIRERFEWLVDGAKGGDNLVFFFSGHGAQLPTRSANETVDFVDETLVAYDFDWSNQTSFTDDAIFDLYSQLPYDTRMLLMFDCCHSGGIHRDGGARARGLTPPDDIRHRALRWDATLGMWVHRKLAPFNEHFAEHKKDWIPYFGESGSVRRLGRAAALRLQTEEDYKKTKVEQKSGPVGPYLPLILEACQEQQLAFEYRHGVTSYGAFTYTLVEKLRQSPTQSIEQLMREVAERLEYLGYDQRPNHLGPKSVLGDSFPSFHETETTATKPASKRTGPKSSTSKRSGSRK
jgi:metacaspase-1